MSILAKAKKLPSGNWRVQASKSVNGKVIKKSFTYPDKKTAEFEAAKWQSELFSYANSNITLKKAIEIYIENRRSILSPTTIASYERIAKNHFKNLQAKLLSNITPNAIQAEINTMSKTLSPKSIRNAYGLLSAAIKEATGESISIRLPRSQKIVYSTPDREASQNILNAAKGTDIELPVTLALRLGLRISEICGLKWCNVRDDYIIIDNVIISYGSERYEKRPKSAAGTRKVPISEDIKKLIDSQPQINEYVYQKNANAIGSAFRRMLKKHNLPACRFHDLRHANASAMALLGIPERYAMSIGGWDTPSVLRQIYQQTFTDAEKDFARKVDEYFTQK